MSVFLLCLSSPCGLIIDGDTCYSRTIILNHPDVYLCWFFIFFSSRLILHLLLKPAQHLHTARHRLSTRSSFWQQNLLHQPNCSCLSKILAMLIVSFCTWWQAWLALKCEKQFTSSSTPLSAVITSRPCKTTSPYDWRIRGWLTNRGDSLVIDCAIGSVWVPVMNHGQMTSW